MREFEVHCQKYPDLKVVIPKNSSSTDRTPLCKEVLNIIQICDERSGGEDCQRKCALPRLLTSHFEETIAAIMSEIKTG